MSRAEDLAHVLGLTEDQVLRPFPADRIVRRRAPGHSGDQVAVTHLGETVVFPSPAELHTDVLKLYAVEIAANRDRAVAQALAEERADVARGARLKADRDRARLLLALRYAIAAGLVAAIAFVGAAR